MKLVSAASFVLAAVAFQPAYALPKDLSAMAQLGKDLFYDQTLSGSSRMSCATCHSPANHFAPDNDLSVQPGGPHLKQFGLRAVPSLSYRMFTPGFSVGPEDSVNEAQEATPMAAAKGALNQAAARLAATPPARGKTKATAATALVPQGGMFWDGRVDTLQDQAQGPLMSPVEMANKSIPALAKKILAKHGKEIALLAGDSVLADPRAVVAEAGFALARYQMENPAFHLFNSKYDEYLAGEAKLTHAEMRGLKLFENPKKGNCADCHPNRRSADGSPPLFTDFQYEALGVPRNPAIPANADPSYFDLGLCGPSRHDTYSRQAANCGLFKTPSLRNVATRKAFFHNGFFHSLEDVVRFYAERNAAPVRFYPLGKDGKPEMFNDLPKKYRGNVDVVDPPFNRKYGEKPALTDRDIHDLVAYLKTLTDQ